MEGGPGVCKRSHHPRLLGPWLVLRRPLPNTGICPGITRPEVLSRPGAVISQEHINRTRAHNPAVAQTGRRMCTPAGIWKATNVRIQVALIQERKEQGWEGKGKRAPPEESKGRKFCEPTCNSWAASLGHHKPEKIDGSN